MRLSFIGCIVILLFTIFIGCSLPRVIKPLNVYDITDGNTIELVFTSTSREHGTIASYSGDKQHFRGECIFSTDPSYPPPNTLWRNTYHLHDSSVSTPNNFAEAYGYSKDIQAKPVGTGIIVGDNGTVIELVFFHSTPDFRTAEMQSADGVGRDNNGHYYRVFLSTQSE